MAQTTVFNLKGKFTSVGSCRVWLDNRELFPGPSLRIANHSPSGFSWGYQGSGPAQLALAILLRIKKEGFAKAHYQKFKAAVIAKIPGSKDFSITVTLDEKHPEDSFFTNQTTTVKC